jgi:hypothetical protein
MNWGNARVGTTAHYPAAEDNGRYTDAVRKLKYRPRKALNS